MSEEKVTKAIENADSSVSIESVNNDSMALKLIKQALENSKNNGSFFNELIRLAREKTEEVQEEEQNTHGSK